MLAKIPIYCPTFRAAKSKNVLVTSSYTTYETKSNATFTANLDAFPRFGGA
jgi:hypothetical protein